MLHVNPMLDQKGMLVVFNPLAEPVEKTIRVNLYYTGLTDRATVRAGGGQAVAYELNRDYAIDIPVKIGPADFAWYVIE
jgi:hypothetical protein